MTRRALILKICLAAVALLCFAFQALAAGCGGFEDLYVDNLTSGGVTIKWNKTICGSTHYMTGYGVYYSENSLEHAAGDSREYSQEPVTPAFYKNAKGSYVKNNTDHKTTLKNLKPDTVYYVNVTLFCQNAVEKPRGCGDIGYPPKYTIKWSEEQLTKTAIIRTLPKSTATSGFYVKKITPATIELAWDTPKPPNVGSLDEDDFFIVPPKKSDVPHPHYDLNYNGMHLSAYGNSVSVNGLESNKWYDLKLEFRPNGGKPYIVYDPLEVRTLRGNHLDGVVEWYQITDTGILTFKLLGSDGGVLQPLSERPVITPTAYCSTEAIFRLMLNRAGDLYRESGASIAAKVMRSHQTGNIVKVYDEGVCTIKLESETESNAADIERVVMDNENPKVMIAD